MQLNKVAFFYVYNQNIRYVILYIGQNTDYIIVGTNKKLKIMNATFLFESESRNLKIQEKLEIIDNYIFAEYGFNSKMNQTQTYEPGLGLEKYRIHSSIKPRKGDKLTHLKTNRTFIFGETTGFVCYEIELLENGKIVGKLKFEEYYKD